MIRLTLAPEPKTFHATVRAPGQNAIAAIQGQKPPHRRTGRPIQGTKTVGGKPVPKTLDDFPYWQECLDDLYEAYRGICAYHGRRIERADHPGVDHFVAKSNHAMSLAYEWDNYRLACADANTQKNKYPGVLDPTSIQDGWFQIDFVTRDVKPDPTLAVQQRQDVEQTIGRLRLREGKAREARAHALDHFREGRATIEYLDHDHPFLAMELRRQGITSAAHLPKIPPAVNSGPEPEMLTPST